MKKIIVSGFALYKMLHELPTRIFAGSPSYEMSVECKDGYLKLEGIERAINAEAQGDWTIKIEFSKISRLMNLLRVVPDQPLVITFKNPNGWIEIHSIQI